MSMPAPLQRSVLWPERCDGPVAMINFPPQRILVPFDFSATSRAALATARGLSERFGSRLEAFYVEPGPGGPLIGEECVRRQGVLKKLAHAVGPDVGLHLADGPAAPAILRHARLCGADLIVMGTQGRVGLRRLR